MSIDWFMASNATIDSGSSGITKFGLSIALNPSSEHGNGAISVNPVSLRYKTNRLGG
jgi:hypothetical protein